MATHKDATATTTKIHGCSSGRTTVNLYDVMIKVQDDSLHTIVHNHLVIVDDGEHPSEYRWVGISRAIALREYASHADNQMIVLENGWDDDVVNLGRAGSTSEPTSRGSNQSPERKRPEKKMNRTKPLTL